MEMAEGQNQFKIAPKQIKSDEIMEEVEEDRISMLPDCLLLEILSRLPSTKCAIRTGTLSKRWEHLWTWVPTLNFERNVGNQSGSDFVLMVSKTLAQCRQLKLKKFRVHTTYDIRFESQLNSWIHYAISCNVEELNFTLSNLKWGVNKFLLDQLFFTNSCFTDITLAGCVFDLTEAVTWKNLRSLSMSCGYLNEELIEKILLGSPLLETMVLVYCYGYRRLDITSKSLKNLVISGYDYEYDDPFDIIKINAPNILFLTIQDGLVLENLLLLNVSSLVKANLDYINVWPYETMEEEMLKRIYTKSLPC